MGNTHQRKLNKPILRRSIGDGIESSVVVYGTASLKNVAIDPGSVFIIENLIGEYNEGRPNPFFKLSPARNKQPEPYEIKVPSSFDIVEVARFLAAPALQGYALQTALVDTRKASRTARETDHALSKFDRLMSIGHVGCVFVTQGYLEGPSGEEQETVEASASRIEKIRTAIASYDIPTLDLLVVRATPDLLEADRSMDGAASLYAEQRVFIPPLT